MLETALEAASSRSLAETIGSLLSLRIRLASSTFVPVKKRYTRKIILDLQRVFLTCEPASD